MAADPMYVKTFPNRYVATRTIHKDHGRFVVTDEVNFVVQKLKNAEELKFYCQRLELAGYKLRRK